jgi:hypothetical protein
MACIRPPRFRDKKDRSIRCRAAFVPADLEREAAFRKHPQTAIKSRAELEALIAAAPASKVKPKPVS